MVAPSPPPSRRSRPTARAERLARWMAAHPWITVVAGLAAIAVFSLPTLLTRGPTVETAAVVLVMAAAGALLGTFWAVSAARRLARERARRQAWETGEPRSTRSRRPIEPPV